MICHKCGNENEDNAVFCSKCGEALNKPPEEKIDQPEKGKVKKEKVKKEKVKKEKKEKVKKEKNNSTGNDPAPEDSNITYSKKPRFLTVLLVLSIIASFGVNSFLSYDILKREPENFVTASKQKTEKSDEYQMHAEKAAEIAAIEEELENSGSFTFSPKTSDIEISTSVTDKNSALKLLESISSDLNLDYSENEFFCSDVKEYHNKKIYTIKQKYNGYEVDSGTIIMQTDKSGNVLSVSGNQEDLNGFNAEPVFTYDDAYNRMINHLTNKYNFDKSNINVKEHDLKIFKYQDMTVLGYRFDIGLRTIIIDSKTLSVVSDTDMNDYGMVSFDGTAYPQLDGQIEKQSPDLDKYDDKLCYLKDSERNITIYMPENEDSQIADNIDAGGIYGQIKVETEPETSSDKTEAKKYKITNKPDVSSVDAITNLQKIYDFFKYNYGRKGVSDNELPVYMKINSCYNDKGEVVDFTDNAFMSGNRLMAVNVRSDPSQPEFSCMLDILAHEFAHGVAYDSSDSPLSEIYDFYDPTTGDLLFSRQRSVQLSINEAIADIMAVIIEDYAKDGAIDGNGCDWNITDIRDLARPSDFDSGNYKHITDARDFITGTTDCHQGASVLGHAAYQMCSGTEKDKNISTLQLSDMLYNILPNLTNKTEFEHFRTIFEDQAVSDNINGNITDKQLEGVIDAFDEAGIRNAYYYSLEEKAVLTVYDVNYLPYNNFNVKIYKGKNTKDSNLISDENSESAEYTLPAAIVPGIYTIVITDNNDSLSPAVEKNIIVNDNSIAANPVTVYKPSADIYTKFGSKSTQVVLCIDRSGSMDGTAMTETKKAAVMFAAKVLELNPSSRISIISYSDKSEINISVSNDLNKITDAINKLHASGNTNMYSGMTSADTIYDYDSPNKKMLVIMSDGLPNTGGSTDDIKAFSEKLRGKDVNIFSLGFFHNLSGSDLSTGISIMKMLTENEFYYNIRSSDELLDTFDLLADQISGENYITAEIACPVDVTVTYNGETLSSDPDNYNTKTSFGYLSFEEVANEDDDDEDSNKNDDLKKTLRLKAGLDYEISISGTGKGKMNYTISYPNEEGEYKDVRTFSNIPITKDTLISTRTDEKSETVLNIDSDSDGKIDKQYTALKNKKGKLKEKTDYLPIIRNILIGIAAFLFVLQIILMIRRIADNKKCKSCKTKLSRKANVCPNCGQPRQKISVIFGKKTVRKPQKKGAVIAKLIFTFIFAGITAAGLLIYNSAPTRVYRHMTEYNYSLAKNLYKREVKNSDLYSKYLNLLTEKYLDKVQTGIDDNELNKETVVSICSFIKDLKLNDSSDTSKEILEGINEQEKTAE